MPEPEHRGRGRPRTKPEGRKVRRVEFDDAEFAAVREKAVAAGLPANEWMRRAILRAAAKR